MTVHLEYNKNPKSNNKLFRRKCLHGLLNRKRWKKLIAGDIHVKI